MQCYHKFANIALHNVAFVAKNFLHAYFSSFNKISSQTMITGRASKSGEFVRSTAKARDFLDTDKYPWIENRYILYIAHACGWASRANAVAHLMKLTDKLDIVVVHPTWQETRPGQDNHAGWAFAEKNQKLLPRALKDKDVTVEEAGILSNHNNHVDVSQHKAKFLRDLYEIGGFPLGTNVFSTPMLFDKKTSKVVNNESSEIIRMFNDISHKYYNSKLDLFPKDKEETMDEIDAWIYSDISNGVYRCGFAQTQSAYDKAAVETKAGMERLEKLLAANHAEGKKFLLGNELTISDIKVYVTLIRMDEVYVVYFKCPFATLRLYPNVFRYTARLYQMKEFFDTTNMADIKNHYFTSHPILNMLAIVPKNTGIMDELLACKDD